MKKFFYLISLFLINGIVFPLEDATPTAQLDSAQEEGREAEICVVCLSPLPSPRSRITDTNAESPEAANVATGQHLFGCSDLHAFHPHCIERWQEQQQNSSPERPPSCPTCRTPSAAPPEAWQPEYDSYDEAAEHMLRQFDDSLALGIAMANAGQVYHREEDYLADEQGQFQNALRYLNWRRLANGGTLAPQNIGAAIPALPRYSPNFIPLHEVHNEQEPVSPEREILRRRVSQAGGLGAFIRQRRQEQQLAERQSPVEETTPPQSEYDGDSSSTDGEHEFWTDRINNLRLRMDQLSSSESEDEI